MQLILKQIILFCQSSLSANPIERKDKTRSDVTFNLMHMLHMLSAPDGAPLEPDSGDERIAIVIDNN
jgi:hypothetical protein